MPDLSIPNPTGQPSRTVSLPWLDYASVSVPDNHELILWWAQYLWLTDGNYRSAMQRVLAHFITAIDFPDLDSEEESEFRELFTQHLNYRKELNAVGEDFTAYGNCFVTVYAPFRRMLACQGCATELQIHKVDYELHLDSDGVRWGRKRPCPKCRDRRDFLLRDRKDPDLSRIRIRRYSPFDIEIAYNPHSGRKDIYWRPPATERRDILTKSPVFIEDTPIEVLEAVAKNQVLRFHHDAILHLDETVISGMATRGWGIPRAISNFRTAWLMQVTNRADQAIATDYTLGWRYLSPAPTAGGMDPLQISSMDEWRGMMESTIQKSRANPAQVHTVPFPVQYQFVGGEGANLLPPDKLKFRQQEYLNQLGVPAEYYSMTLSAQAAPMALQLFESCWQNIPALYNKLLNWVVKQVSRTYGLKETEVQIRASTIAYDETRKQLLSQLMAANQISPSTALQPLGIDATKEVEKVFRHQDFVAKVQAEHQEQAKKDQEMGALQQLAGAPSPSSMVAQAQQGGAPPPGAPMGGMPGGGAPGGGPQANTLQGMADQAAQIAQQLSTMPEYDRKQQLRSIRESNKQLHALVMADLEQIRGQARSQGQQQLLATPPAGGGAPQQ